jgi:nitrogen fixation protein FixH
MMKPDFVDAGEARPVTGRKVLFAFVAFFAVVFSVNAIMVRFATSTFGGVDADRAYQVGLAFNREIAAAEGQNALGWDVQAHFAERGTGRTELTLRIRDARDAVPAGIRVVSHLGHPGDRRRDREIAMTGNTQGVFTGVVDDAAGQWDLVLEVWREDQRMFRSVNRVGLK